jgi:carbamate kinase
MVPVGQRQETKPFEREQKKVVIAIGGNAILRNEQTGTFEEQYKNISDTAKGIVSIILGEHSHTIVAIIHGNGPQVGNIAVQQDEAHHGIPGQPMHILNAMTQGQIGYMLQQAIQNEFKRLGKVIPVVSIITQTLVQKNDPAFTNGFRAKPIGPFYTEGEAKKLMETKNYTIKKVKPKGEKIWRRVVPSPQPINIVEIDALKKIVSTGCLVIAGGGGGIPVIQNNDGSLKGTDAVIDKDLIAGLLGKSVGGSILMILTDIEKVMINFGKPNETPISNMSLSEVKKHLDNGQFLDGSMEPKIRSSINFLESGGDMAIITSIDKAIDALNGTAGSRIVRSRHQQRDI